MKVVEWLRNRFKTELSKKELLIMVALDIFLCNLAFFMGILTTVFVKGFTWDTTPKSFYNQMIHQVWFTNFPLLTFCCLFSFALNWFYRGTTSLTYFNKILLITRAVALAFLFFLSLIYLTEAFVPRSTIVATVFFAFTLILAVRLTWAFFSRHYYISPSTAYNPEIEKVVRELTVLSQQDGWVPPASSNSNSAWPYFEDDEVVAAAAVLRSGKVNRWTGKEIEKFQEEFSVFCGVRYAIALTNGSVALDLALYALDIGLGDEVIVTPRTFIASASCIVLRGAKPVFVDVHPESQSINCKLIKQAITSRTKAIIAVHLAGWPCDMDPLLDIAAEHNLKVIEDCAQCHGAVYYSRRPGGASAIKQEDPVEKNGILLYPRITGSMGDMAAFSFCQDKIMTTGGEGGMLVTNDELLWEKAWAFKDHGKSYDAVYHRQHSPGFRWLHESLGTNYRMTEMQAAIGRRQLRKLPEWLAIRRRNAMILTEQFSKINGIRVTRPPENIKHAYYKYYAFIRPERLKQEWDRDRVMNDILAAGIPCFSGSCSEVYLEKAFDGNNLRPVENLPVAKELGETSLMFLVHPTLTEKDMMNAAAIVSKVMMIAGK